MEGWRQERLGSRAGTHREEEKNKNILTRKKKRKKTYLTLTGLLMEGLSQPVSLNQNTDSLLVNRGGSRVLLGALLFACEP